MLFSPVNNGRNRLCLISPIILAIWQIISATDFAGNGKSSQFFSGAADNYSAQSMPAINISGQMNVDKEVDLSSGSVRLDVPLTSLTEMGRLKTTAPGNLSLNYSNQIRNERYASNRASQAAIVGLGWNMSYSPAGIRAIVVDHKKTVISDDDQYFLVTNSGNVSLLSWYETGAKKFRIGYEPNTNVEAYWGALGIIGFKVTLTDGTIANFGDYRTSPSGEDPSNSTWYTPYKGLWVGYGGSEVAPATQWGRYPYKFELSQLKDAFGNCINYKYNKTDGKTFNHSTMAAYTQDVTLDEITFTSSASRIKFNYNARESFEYGDQDQLFEIYSRSYLSSIDIKSDQSTFIKSYAFSYALCNTDLSRFSVDKRKRLLEAIVETAPKIANPADTDRRLLWAFDYYSGNTGWENYLKSYNKLGGMSKEFTYAQNTSANVHTDLQAAISSNDEDITIDKYVLNNNYLALGDFDGTKIYIYNFEGKWIKTKEIIINGSLTDDNAIVHTYGGGTEPFCNLIGLFGTPQYLVAVLAETQSVGNEIAYRTRYIQPFHFDGVQWHKDNRADITVGLNGYWRTNHAWLRADSAIYAVGNDFYVVATHSMKNAFAGYWDPNSHQWTNNENAAVAQNISTPLEVYWSNLQCGNDFFIAELTKRKSFSRPIEMKCNETQRITDWFIDERSPATLLAPHWDRSTKQWLQTTTTVFSWANIDKWFGLYWYLEGSRDGGQPTYIKLQPGIVENNHVILGVSYCNNSEGDNQKGRSRIYDITWDSSNKRWIGNNVTNYAADNSWGTTSDDQAIITDNSSTRSYAEGIWPCKRTATLVKMIRDLFCSSDYFVYKLITHYDSPIIFPGCAHPDEWYNYNHLYGNVFTGEGWKNIYIGNIGRTGADCNSENCINEHYLRDAWALPDYLVFDLRVVANTPPDLIFKSRSYIANFYRKSLSFSPIVTLFDRGPSWDDDYFRPFRFNKFAFGNDFIAASEYIESWLGCEETETHNKVNGIHFPIYNWQEKKWYSNLKVGEQIASGKPAYYHTAQSPLQYYKIAAGDNFFIYFNGAGENRQGKLVRRYNEAPYKNAYSQPNVDVFDMSNYSWSPCTLMAGGSSFLIGVNSAQSNVFKFDSLTNTYAGSVPDYPVSSVKIGDGIGNYYTYAYSFENGIHSPSLSKVNYGTAKMTDPVNNVFIKKFVTPETDLATLNTETGYTYLASDLPYLVGMNYRSYSTRTTGTKVYSSEEQLYKRISLTGTYPIAGADELKEKHIKMVASKTKVDEVTKQWEYAYDPQFGNECKNLFKNGVKSLLNYTEYAYTVGAYQNTNIASFPYFKAAYEVNTAVYSISDNPNAAAIRKAQVITYTEGNPKYGWEQWNWQVLINSYGVPVENFIMFNLSNKNSNNWICSGTNSKADLYGNIVEVTDAVGVKSAKAFRTDEMLPIGSVVNNVPYTECGIFTGDYTDGKSPNYWDYSNGWEKDDVKDANGAYRVTLSSDPANVHFGQKSIHAITGYAAGRNNRVIPGKAYVMTAWVKVISGTIQMATNFWYANSQYQQDEMPVNGAHITVDDSKGSIWATPISSTDCNGKWKLMCLDIPASKTSQLSNTGTWFARAWVGNDRTAPAFEAYVDDVRFYPADAMVSTEYYDYRGNVIAEVDPNGSAKYYVYDSFDRLISARNNAKQLVKEYKYHLIGKDAYIRPTMALINYAPGNFYIDATEVTQASYSNLMSQNPSRYIGAEKPVHYVTWYDAILYCNARSKAEGFDTAYTYTSKAFVSGQCTNLSGLSWLKTKNGYRLPTDAEWTFAYRAGNTTDDFYWGSATDAATVKQYAWYGMNANPLSPWTDPHASEQGPQPVAQKLPNAWGLCDMAGNVREWLWSDDPTYASAKTDGCWTDGNPAFLTYSSSAPGSKATCEYSDCRTGYGWSVVGFRSARNAQ